MRRSGLSLWHGVLVLLLLTASSALASEAPSASPSLQTWHSLDLDTAQACSMQDVGLDPLPGDVPDEPAGFCKAQGRDCFSSPVCSNTNVGAECEINRNETGACAFTGGGCCSCLRSAPADPSETDPV